MVNFYIVASVYGEMAPWTFGVLKQGVSPQGIGTIGMALNFLVALGLTPFCRPPSDHVKNLVDLVRQPEAPAVAVKTASEH